MNDGDLNENIDDHTQAIDGHHDGSGTVQNEAGGDQIHLDPSRWWFASSAFPMIAGTLGPVASAFSICALVRPWRQYIPPGLTVTQAEFVNDPIWLTVINAIQLLIAIISNIFLLLNMTRRVRFSIAQPITIVGWYISAICLVALSATAGGPLVLEPRIDHIWSQAFYYGIYAAILYFIVASLMVVTVWGAHTGRYEKDFELTTSQRTLMLQTIMFLSYLLLGALVFSTIEGWNYLDTVYWADVTLFTVGYGDFSPATSLGRALLMPYALIGVISLGLVIGSIRSLVLDRGKRRLDARMLEKKRRQLLRKMTRKGQDEVLEPIDDRIQDGGSESRVREKGPQNELQRRQKEFEMMREVQEKSSRRRRWAAMGISASTWLALWLVGAKIFEESERPYQNWSYFDSFYFAFTGLTTIGYGDLSPVSPSGKAFFVFWSLLALPTMTVLISNAGDTVVKYIRDGTIKLGNLTILPGEHGFRRETKQLAAKLTRGGKFNNDDIEEDPPGFLGAARDRHEEDDEEADIEGSEVAESGDESDSPTGKIDSADSKGKQKTSMSGSLPERNELTKTGTNKSQTPSKSKQGASPTTPTTKNKHDHYPPPRSAGSMERDDIPAELPKSQSEYHLVLIDEITRVTKHLQSSPPRKYTFKEWAWYLRLMGEDESSSETHRKAARKPSGKDAHGELHVGSHGHTLDKEHSTPDASDKPADGDQPGSRDGKSDEEKLKWSWIGHRSPLMDTKEEAEWILDRLEQKLRDELQAVVKDQQGTGGLQQVRMEEKHNEHFRKKKDPALMGGD